MGLKFGQEIIGAWREIEPVINTTKHVINLGFRDVSLETYQQVNADYATVGFDNEDSLKIMQNNAEILIGDWDRIEDCDDPDNFLGYEGDPQNQAHRDWLFKAVPGIPMLIMSAWLTVHTERVEKVKKFKIEFDERGTREGNSEPSSGTSSAAETKKKSPKKPKKERKS